MVPSSCVYFFPPNSITLSILSCPLKCMITYSLFICFLYSFGFDVTLILVWLFLFVVLMLLNLYLQFVLSALFSVLTGTLCSAAFLGSSLCITYKCLNQIVTSWKGSWTFLPESFLSLIKTDRESGGGEKGGQGDQAEEKLLYIESFLCVRLCTCIFLNPSSSLGDTITLFFAMHSLWLR